MLQIEEQDKAYKETHERLSEYRSGQTRENPFSVHNTLPGVIPYFFDTEWLKELQARWPQQYREHFQSAMLSHCFIRTEVGLEFLADQCERDGYFGQIAGPHGSGKSTLMQGLARKLRERAIQILYQSLHDRQRSLTDVLWDELERFSRSTDQGDPSQENSLTQKIVFLDGYEQLSYYSRLTLAFFCRTNRLGLVLSTHMPVWGFPVLFRTIPSTEALRCVLDYLLDESDCVVGREYAADLFKKYRGNIRDTLFALYDEYERHRVFSYHGEISSVRYLGPARCHSRNDGYNKECIDKFVSSSSDPVR